MANANAPSGFNPVRYVSGQPYSGSVNLYSVPSGDATALMIGDPVKLVGTSQVIGESTYTDIARAATGDVILGAVVSVLPVTRSSTVYREASTQRIIAVADDPNILFEIQDLSTGTPLAAADIGLNVDFVVAAGSTITGKSGVTLNNATEATTNTLDCKLIGFVNRPDNEVGASGKWLVRLNRHQYANQVAGV